MGYQCDIDRTIQFILKTDRLKFYNKACSATVSKRPGSYRHPLPQTVLALLSHLLSLSVKWVSNTKIKTLGLSKHKIPHWGLFLSITENSYTSSLVIDQHNKNVQQNPIYMLKLQYLHRCLRLFS